MLCSNRSCVMACVAMLGAVFTPAVRGAGAGARRVGQPDLSGGYSSSRIIVKFAPGVMADTVTPRYRAANQGRAGARAGSDPALPVGVSVALRERCGEWDVTGIRRLHQAQFAKREAALRCGLDRTYVVDVPAGTDTSAMAATFSALQGEIEYAEVDGIGGVAEVFIPDDDQFWRQYGLHNTGQTSGLVDADIDAPEAWKLHTGDLGTVTVAILDSGVNPHEDFEGRMVAGINTDDPATPDLTSDGCPHGTHIAGIVAAGGNNGLGVAGVTWGASIMPVRVLNGCSGFESSAAAGIVWAVDHGADIINVSLQFCAGTTVFRDAVDYAHDQGVLIVSAAGNNDFCGAGLVAYPGRFANSMAVSGTNHNDELATLSNTNFPFWSSNSGSQIDVCAAGDRIRSTWTADGYHWLNGTSTASPLVAGLAALLKSFVPELTPDDLRSVITTTADDLGPAGWDHEYGYGRINAFSAILEVAGPRIVWSLPPDGAIDARQPSEPNGSSASGWHWIDLFVTGDAAGYRAADFSVSQDGGVSPAPFVLAVQPLEGEYNLRVVLSWRIAVEAWTTLTHIDSGTSVRLGYLPVDANGDGTAAPADLLTLIEAVDEPVNPPPIWATDIDRSGRVTPADILRAIDLLNGADQYELFNGATLP